MPLPEPFKRRLHHQRSIQVDAYARDDGLWDLDARLVDLRSKDVQFSTGLRRAGEPIHEMLLRVTIDTQLNIRDVAAHSAWVPYPTNCDTIGDAYKRLIGLNLLIGFRNDVKRLLGGVLGCTHMTELCSVLPTAAIQAFAGTVFNTQDGVTDDANEAPMPFQLNRCHALRTDGEAVRNYYPAWYGRPLEPAVMPMPHKSGAAASPAKTVEHRDSEP